MWVEWNRRARRHIVIERLYIVSSDTLRGAILTESFQTQAVLDHSHGLSFFLSRFSGIYWLGLLKLLTAK